MDTTEITQRKSFSELKPIQQLAWDSTSLGALKRCPRFYEYSIVRGFVPRGESVHLFFGHEFHAALETYDREKASGKGKDEATLAAVRRAMTSTWSAELGRPWFSDEPTKTRETLIRSIIWYLDQFSEDPCETTIMQNGQPAVELPFRLSIEVECGTTGEQYLLCGYLDRMVDFQGGRWITDRKTTKTTLSENYFAKYSPNNQVTLYTLAGTIISSAPIAGLIIDAGQVAVTFSRFQRAHIGRTQPQLEEWLKDAIMLLEVNERYVTEEYWPQNDVACDMYGGCPYRPVCSASPEIRPRLLDGLYSRRSWDPLLTREL